MTVCLSIFCRHIFEDTGSVWFGVHRQIFRFILHLYISVQYNDEDSIPPRNMDHSGTGVWSIQK